MSDINNTIIMPQIPESLREPKDSEQYFVELERILVEMFGGDQWIVGDLEVGGSVTIGGSLNLTGGLTAKSTLVSDTESPYTVLDTDLDIFCDTDSGDVTVLLPAGIDERKLRILNVGSSGNLVYITPNGSEDLIGENTPIHLDDTEVIDLGYQTIKGWY